MILCYIGTNKDARAVLQTPASVADSVTGLKENETSMAKGSTRLPAFTPATCHPEKPNKGKGLCKNCYERERLKNETPEQSERRRANVTKRRQKNLALYAQKRREHYWKDPEKNKQATRRYYRKHTDRVKAVQKEWALKNPDKVKAQQLRKFGITLEDYQRLFEKQGGVCAICKQPETEARRTLAVDHCHNSNIVRGLLCGKCNKGIGLLRDDVEILKSAIEYLTREGGDV